MCALGILARAKPKARTYCDVMSILGRISMNVKCIALHCISLHDQVDVNVVCLLMRIISRVDMKVSIWHGFGFSCNNHKNDVVRKPFGCLYNVRATAQFHAIYDELWMVSWKKLVFHLAESGRRDTTRDGLNALSTLTNTNQVRKIKQTELHNKLTIRCYAAVTNRNYVDYCRLIKSLFYSMIWLADLCIA